MNKSLNLVSHWATCNIVACQVGRIRVSWCFSVVELLNLASRKSQGIWNIFFSIFLVALKLQVQSNLLNTDTKGTEQSVCFTEVSILIEVGNVWSLAFQGSNKLSIIKRCPYYRGVRKERLDCSDIAVGTVPTATATGSISVSTDRFPAKLTWV